MTPEESTYLVRIGGTAKQSLLSQLHEAGVCLNQLGEALFADPRFVVASSSSEVRVTVRSVRSLGLAVGGTFEQVTSKAGEHGPSLCPLELGPHFRLQFLNQPEGALGHPVLQNQAPLGSITVASEPLDEDDQTPKGFYLRRINGVLWLKGYRAGPGHLWSPQDVLAFVQRANAA